MFNAIIVNKFTDQTEAGKRQKQVCKKVWLASWLGLATSLLPMQGNNLGNEQ